MNIALRIEYDGGAFAGWQRQANAMSVQQLLEEAVERITGTPVTLHGAGRTDAGVHALGQVAHFHTASRIPPEKWRLALNRVLPPAVRVQDSCAVGEDFHARYWAVGKRYVYLLRPCAVDSALWRGRAWQLRHGVLDAARLRQAAALLEGEHDFAAFHSTGSGVRDTVRRLYRVRAEEWEGMLRLEFVGNGFLYNMVRILTGTLAEAAMGKRGLEEIRAALESGERRFAGITAPAEGLYMAEVYYPRRQGVPAFASAGLWWSEDEGKGDGDGGSADRRA